MSSVLPESLHIKGVIRTKTFKTFPTEPKRCSFKLKEITILDPILSEQERSTVRTALEDTKFVYWAEMKHFLPVLRYTVELFNAKLKPYRGDFQYNIEKDNLVLSEKKIKDGVKKKTEEHQNPIKNYHENVNAAIISLFQLQDRRLIGRMEQMMATDKEKYPNLAHIMASFNITTLTKSLNNEKKTLLARFGTDGCHLSNYSLLHSHGIKIPEPDVASKTKDIVLLLFTNPYAIRSPANYELYREYKALSFDKMERIAMDLYGAEILKDTEIVPYRYAAALISVIIEYEIQTGSTIVAMKTAVELVAKKIHQAERIVAETFQQYSSIIYQHLIVSDVRDVTDVSVDRMRLQRPEMQRKESLILDWVRQNSSELSSPLAINEQVLASVLDCVYGQATRDPFQIKAIRLAISSPVTLLSGPPGSGKTTFVVRSIVRYIETIFQTARKHYTAQQQQREQNDHDRVMKNLTSFAKNMYRKYYIVGELNPDTIRGTSFDDWFDDQLDSLRMQGQRNKNMFAPLMVHHFKRICQSKLYELKKNHYRLFAQTDLSGAKMMAPSGVASRRLRDACDGHETHTCCSLLAQLEEDATKKSELRDIFPFRMMIIDESSMIDMDTLIQTIKMANENTCQVLLIGDHHQLPPIGTGQVFRDLIKSSLPSVVLTNIYRQGKGSRIAQLSKDIVSSSVQPFDLNINYLYESICTSSFIDKVASDEDEIIRIDYDIAFTRLNDFVAELYEYLVFNKSYDIGQIQILTPYKDKHGGRAEINSCIQSRIAMKRKALNGGRDINQPHAKFFALDPVIHRKNNKLLDIVNGDQGRVLPVLDPEQYKAQNMVPVQYPHQRMNYMVMKTSTNPSLHELELSYALTAHLAQVT